MRITLALVLSAGCAVHADTLRVPSQYPNIQAAIDAAIPGDTVLVADGVYMRTGNVNINLRGKAITVRSENGPAACIIDGQHAGVRAFVFTTLEPRATIVEGFTLNRFNAGEGGGMLIQGSSPTIRGCVFTQCWGSIYGGAVAVKASGNPLIVNCEMRQCLAGAGGGILVDNARAEVVGCLIEGNRVDLFGGGGVYVINNSNVTIDATILRANAAFNFAGYGGGLHMNNSTVTIISSLIEANTATDFGGGVSTAGTAFLNILNTTIVGNSAVAGGGAGWAGTNALIRMGNSILASNFPPDLAGTTADVQYTLSELFITGLGNITGDPLFVNPGGGDYSLSHGSPAIDAGNNHILPSGTLVDLAGQPRLQDDPLTPDTGLGTPPIVDMGALEVQGVTCYADCDTSTGVGILDIFDFLCFGNRFGANDPYACDCDTQTGQGVCDVFDFLCFGNRFAAGCP